ncbi:MAG: UDP-N-acetylmuramate dehydrogenase [Oscillospiraceae bacterium]|nr:UDP-N-acetylmuramate dehydrogenase [Oscillospiraceae bacterium]
MREKLQKLCDTYGTKLLENVPLSEHTTFRIGGTADLWAEVNSTDALSALVRLCRGEHYPYYVLGRGSNILASDAGYRGLILHIGNDFSAIRMEDSRTMVCEAGATLVKAAKTAEEHSRTGMEGLSGIPGSIGGALFMNAGAYNYEMSQIVTSCTYLDKNGEIRERRACDLELSYRHSWFTDHTDNVILTVTMQLEAGDQAEITAKMQDFLARRNEKQPLNYPSAGSTFKRPVGNYASALIDQCGLKGYSVGGAQVSEKHAGFVINRDNATCADVLQLCKDVRRIVNEKTGYKLELEPILLGDPAGK